MKVKCRLLCQGVVFSIALFSIQYGRPRVPVTWVFAIAVVCLESIWNLSRRPCLFVKELAIVLVIVD